MFAGKFRQIFMVPSVEALSEMISSKFVKVWASTQEIASATKFSPL